MYETRPKYRLNILLEFKTKSDNIRYFLDNQTPPNIVCSWSLNTPTIIANEEHFTADLDGRIADARQVADRGVKVSFHFRPRHNEVFFYLCMEKASIWQQAFGYVYADNETLEKEFGRLTLGRKVMGDFPNG